MAPNPLKQNKRCFLKGNPGAISREKEGACWSGGDSGWAQCLSSSGPFHLLETLTKVQPASPSWASQAHLCYPIFPPLFLPNSRPAATQTWPLSPLLDYSLYHSRLPGENLHVYKAIPLNTCVSTYPRLRRQWPSLSSPVFLDMLFKNLKSVCV